MTTALIAAGAQSSTSSGLRSLAQPMWFLKCDAGPARLTGWLSRRWLGVELEVFVRREDAERFLEEIRGDDPEMAARMRIEERELDAGGLN